eukprot:gene7622-1362_t
MLTLLSRTVSAQLDLASFSTFVQGVRQIINTAELNPCEIPYFKMTYTGTVAPPVPAPDAAGGSMYIGDDDELEFWKQHNVELGDTASWAITVCRSVDAGNKVLPALAQSETYLHDARWPVAVCAAESFPQARRVVKSAYVKGPRLVLVRLSFCCCVWCVDTADYQFGMNPQIRPAGSPKYKAPSVIFLPVQGLNEMRDWDPPTDECDYNETRTQFGGGESTAGGSVATRPVAHHMSRAGYAPSQAPSYVSSQAPSHAAFSEAVSDGLVEVLDIDLQDGPDRVVRLSDVLTYLHGSTHLLSFSVPQNFCLQCAGESAETCCSLQLSVLMSSGLELTAACPAPTCNHPVARHSDAQSQKPAALPQALSSGTPSTQSWGPVAHNTAELASQQRALVVQTAPFVPTAEQDVILDAGDSPVQGQAAATSDVPISQQLKGFGIDLDLSDSGDNLRTATASPVKKAPKMMRKLSSRVLNPPISKAANSCNIHNSSTRTHAKVPSSRSRQSFSSVHKHKVTPKTPRESQEKAYNDAIAKQLLVFCFDPVPYACEIPTWLPLYSCNALTTGAKEDWFCSTCQLIPRRASASPKASPRQLLALPQPQKTNVGHHPALRHHHHQVFCVLLHYIFSPLFVCEYGVLPPALVFADQLQTSVILTNLKPLDSRSIPVAAVLKDYSAEKPQRITAWIDDVSLVMQQCPDMQAALPSLENAEIFSHPLKPMSNTDVANFSNSPNKLRKPLLASTPVSPAFSPHQHSNSDSDRPILSPSPIKMPVQVVPRPSKRIANTHASALRPLSTGTAKRPKYVKDILGSQDEAAPCLNSAVHNKKKNSNSTGKLASRDESKDQVSCANSLTSSSAMPKLHSRNHLGKQESATPCEGMSVPGDGGPQDFTLSSLRVGTLWWGQPNKECKVTLNSGDQTLCVEEYDVPCNPTRRQKVTQGLVIPANGILFRVCDIVKIQ